MRVRIVVLRIKIFFPGEACRLPPARSTSEGSSAYFPIVGTLTGDALTSSLLTACLPHRPLA
jgi:hypothetical protein